MFLCGVIQPTCSGIRMSEAGEEREVKDEPVRAHYCGLFSHWPDMLGLGTLGLLTAEVETSERLGLVSVWSVC